MQVAGTIARVLSPLITLFLLLLVALFSTALAVIHLLAGMLLRPPRMTDGKAMYLLRRMSPGDIGMPFETMDFSFRDPTTGPLRIAAWWIAAEGPSNRTCVLVHGFGDAKVGSLAWAAVWRDLGWNLLLVDLRAHGDSGGRLSTGGFFERDDLDAILNDLRARRPDAARVVALFGVSLGGAVVLATAARRDDLVAVVTDSVFADFGSAAIVHGRLIRAPLPSLTPLAIRWAEKVAGVDFAAVAPIRTIPNVRCPLLLIHGDDDPFVPATDIARLADAVAKHSQPLDRQMRFPRVGHCLAIIADAHKYELTLREFLEDALTASDAATTRD